MLFALEKWPRSGIFLSDPGKGEQVGADDLTMYLSAARLFSSAVECLESKQFVNGWENRWVVVVQDHTIYLDEFNRFYGYGRWSNRT